MKLDGGRAAGKRFCDILSIYKTAVQYSLIIFFVFFRYIYLFSLSSFSYQTIFHFLLFSSPKLLFFSCSLIKPFNVSLPLPPPPTLSLSLFLNLQSIFD